MTDDTGGFTVDKGDLAVAGATVICAAYQDYREKFREITRRARSRFENQEWQGMQADSVERLDLYGQIVDGTVRNLTDDILGELCRDKETWVQIRAAYTGMVINFPDLELAETFYNSISRRIFTTLGVNSRIEFVETDFEYFPGGVRQEIFTRYPFDRPVRDVIAAILSYYAFRYEDLDRDCAHVEAEIEKELVRLGLEKVTCIDVLNSVFYRNKGAYIVGRILNGDAAIPFVLALNNFHGLVYVDAALLTGDEISIVFSYTRSYFHVDAAVPHHLVLFLHTLLAHKRLAEIYTSIGYNKHGKTELYRDLLRHLRNSDDQFDIAPGEKGMVMLVFTMPSYDVVFKIIKDRFAEPKTTTRQDVLKSYQLVFKHDRAGRLVDAQEFEHLEFDCGRFTPALLDELKKHASGSVQFFDNHLVIRHLYTERRMTPLDLYVRTMNPQDVVNAIQDYGQAIKDLAATNIFPGDVLLKNFGVTRHDRVVFYDYDELTLLSSCVFRRFPQPKQDSEYMEAEPWFYVGKNDIFPEEFETFLGLPEPYRTVFKDHHSEIFQVEFWRSMQKRHKAGEVVDIFPYKASKRLLGDR